MRVEILVKGVVQGVGFRPFVANAASLFGLNGWVKNTTEGVRVQVEGEQEDVNSFIEYLRSSPPPASQILALHLKNLLPKGYKRFRILASSDGGERSLLICADIATCKRCLKEFYTPSDRRHLYPFINCTDCGPRFTIITDTPYDREKTTMKDFQMCKECMHEYKDARARRFHAQPNACSECGPSFILLDAKGRKVRCKNPLKEAASLLACGKVGLMKGIGGFHIIGSALNAESVERIRKLKGRERKPFALLSLDKESVKKFCKLSKEEEGFLESVQRPILLLEKKRHSPIKEGVAPANKYLGVMLPYTAAHHYIIKESGLLAAVCTSANASDEPMLTEVEEVKKKFAGRVDFILAHNRRVENRCDDSVAFWDGAALVITRRARGFVPLPISLPLDADGIAGCGAELKCTFALAKGELAFISQHIGDLREGRTFSFYKEMMDKYCKFFGIKPHVFIHDLHPQFLSTQFARQNPNHFGVQHHHAHIASCIVEHRIDTPLIGVAMDGVGLGEDGNVWGCEFFLVKDRKFERVAHLLYVPMPGGDVASKQPWRMAVSWLHKVFGEDTRRLKVAKRYKKMSLLIEMIEKGVNSPLTSSMGRLFDAISSLCNLTQEQTYEGEAAMAVEAVADEGVGEKYSISLQKNIYPWLIDPSPLFIEVVEDIERGVPSSYICAAFHNAIASMIKEVCTLLQKEWGIKCVAMSGGVFQNRLLRKKVVRLLGEEGFRVFFNNKVPTNDAGVSVGQILLGAYVLGNSCKSN